MFLDGFTVESSQRNRANPSLVRGLAPFRSVAQRAALARAPLSSGPGIFLVDGDSPGPEPARGGRGRVPRAVSRIAGLQFPPPTGH